MTMKVRDPADQREVVGQVPAMSVADVEAAYKRARGAFEIWRRTNPLDRAAVLERAADLRESGSPFKEQGAPGLRFYTRIKTSAVRFSW